MTSSELLTQQVAIDKTKLTVVAAPILQERGFANDPRSKAIDLTMKRYQHSQDALIEVLHKAQASFGYLEDDVLIYIARGLKLPLSRVYGVATFYHLFTLKPSGVHTCVVCLGTACHVKGSDKLVAALESELGIQMGETTPDQQVSLMVARCVGACGIAPVIVIDGAVSGKQTPAEAIDRVRQLTNISPHNGTELGEK